MMPTGFWKVLHLFFAFSYVGSLVVGEWNGRAARATQDWSQRVLLFQIAHLSSRVAGFGALILLGVFGNLHSMQLGYTMRADVWTRVVNGLWLVAILGMAVFNVSCSGRLTEIARQAASGGTTQGYQSALARWRFGNVAQSALYLALLCLMVFHWRS